MKKNIINKRSHGYTDTIHVAFRKTNPVWVTWFSIYKHIIGYKDIYEADFPNGISISTLKLKSSITKSDLFFYKKNRKFWLIFLMEYNYFKIPTSGSVCFFKSREEAREARKSIDLSSNNYLSDPQLWIEI